MYNGQVGGYDKVWWWFDNMILDDFFWDWMGGMDSESLFLVVFVYGFWQYLCVVMVCVVYEVEVLLKYVGMMLYMWFVVVWLDGDIFYVVCYVLDWYVLMFYYCQFDDGVMVVLELLDEVCNCWKEVLQGYMIIVFEGRVDECLFWSDE